MLQVDIRSPVQIYREISLKIHSVSINLRLVVDWSWFKNENQIEIIIVTPRLHANRTNRIISLTWKTKCTITFITRVWLTFNPHSLDLQPFRSEYFTLLIDGESVTEDEKFVICFFFSHTQKHCSNVSTRKKYPLELLLYTDHDREKIGRKKKNGTIGYTAIDRKHGCSVFYVGKENMARTFRPQ